MDVNSLYSDHMHHHILHLCANVWFIQVIGLLFSLSKVLSLSFVNEKR